MREFLGSYRNTAVIVCLVSIFLILSASPAVSAGDIDIVISGQAIQKFFNAAAPLKFKYELAPGTTAAEITLSNPKLVLNPGKPGNIFIEMDYQGESKLLGLPPFSGRTKPEVVFKFVPERSILQGLLQGLTMKAGAMNIKLDGLVQPIDIPLTSGQPLVLETHEVKAAVTAARTEVTNSGLRLTADYNFIRAPRK